MTQLQTILTIIAAIMFTAPFFIWGILRFLDKKSQKVVWWHKKLIFWSFIIGEILFLILMLLAIFI